MQVKKATGEEMLKLWGSQGFDTSSPRAEYFCNNITEGNAAFWFLDRDGEAIAELYAFFDLADKTFADGRTTAYLCAFRVKAEYRGQGHGTRLMTAVLAELKEMGFRYATIGVGSDEPRNLRLYQRFGFSMKIGDCHYDPCGMDENMQPIYDDTVWWLLRKSL